MLLSHLSTFWNKQYEAVSLSYYNYMETNLFIFLIMVLGPVIGSGIGVLKRPFFGFIALFRR